MDAYYQRLGQRIRRARHDAGLKLEEVADSLGVDKSALHRWEVGDRKATLPTLQRIADALGVEFDALLADDKARGG